MNVKTKIERIESLLKDYGFDNNDYIISMQGPTLIFTKVGLEKMEQTLPLKAELMSMRVQIM
jgi:hypothetical protein